MAKHKFSIADMSVLAQLCVDEFPIEKLNTTESTFLLAIYTAHKVYTDTQLTDDETTALVAAQLALGEARSARAIFEGLDPFTIQGTDERFANVKTMNDFQATYAVALTGYRQAITDILARVTELTNKRLIAGVSAFSVALGGRGVSATAGTPSTLRSKDMYCVPFARSGVTLHVEWVDALNWGVWNGDTDDTKEKVLDSGDFPGLSIGSPSAMRRICYLWVTGHEDVKGRAAVTALHSGTINASDVHSAGVGQPREQGDWTLVYGVGKAKDWIPAILSVDAFPDEHDDDDETTVEEDGAE